jgi:hypothetical protein
VTPDVLVHTWTEIELSALLLQSVLIRNCIPEGTKCSRLCHYVFTFGLVIGKGTFIVFWDVTNYSFVLGT